MQPPDDPKGDELPDVEYACPRCGAPLVGDAERCPQCGGALDEEYYATYRPPKSRAVRLIALAVLVLCFLVPIGLFVWSLWAS